MRRVKWIVAAAIAFVPTLALAEEPAGQPVAPGQGVRWQINPFQPGEQQIIVLGEDTKRPGEPLPLGQGEQVKELEQARLALTATFNDAKREKGSYLGVSASPPPAVLRKQLGLQPGMGLVVDLIVPDSPAAKAGIERFDVLQKLDDQLIVNPPQLAVLVRSHKPGDEIKLGIIHDGKPTTLSVKLVEHDLEPLAEEGEENEQVERLHRFMPEPRMMQILPGAGLRPGAAWGAPGVAAGSATWIEEGHSYTVVTDREGHKTFTAKDKEGKVLFEGPIDTREQRDKLPADQKEKLGQMEQHIRSTTVNPFWGGKMPATQPAKPEKESEKK